MHGADQVLPDGVARSPSRHAGPRAIAVPGGGWGLGQGGYLADLTAKAWPLGTGADTGVDRIGGMGKA